MLIEFLFNSGYLVVLKNAQHDIDQYSWGNKAIIVLDFV